MSAEPEIVTTGRGEVVLPATHATMRFDVETRAATAADAAAQNGVVTRRVQGAIDALGLADPMLRVTGFRVAPEYVYEQERRLVGYLARSLVEVSLRAMSRCGALLDAALGAGATAAHDPEFVATGREEARARALQLAFGAARADAEALAAASGGTLGAARMLTTAEGGVRAVAEAGVMAMRSDVGGGAPDVRDDVRVEAFVQVSWELLKRG